VYLRPYLQYLSPKCTASYSPIGYKRLGSIGPSPVLSGGVGAEIKTQTRGRPGSVVGHRRRIKSTTAAI